jgi:hypothetical protein
MKTWTTVACILLGMAAVAGAYSAGRANAPAAARSTAHAPTSHSHLVVGGAPASGCSLLRAAGSGRAVALPARISCRGIVLNVAVAKSHTPRRPVIVVG